MKYHLLFLLLTAAGVQAQSTLKSNKLAVDTLFFSNKERALELCNTSLPQAKRNQDTFHITYFLDQAGEINRFQGKLYLAESQLKECLTYKKNWKDLKDLSLTHNNLGKTYKMMGNYELAIHEFIIALELMETDKNLLGQGFYLNNIATVFDEQHNYPKAIEYYARSLKIKEEIKDTSGISASTYNLGVSYFNLKDYPTALNYFERSYRSSTYQKDATKRARALKSMSECYRELGELSSANKYILEAYKLRDQIDDKILLSGILNARAISYLDSKEFALAKKYNAEAVRIVLNNGASKAVQNALFTRSLIFEKAGELDSALYFLKAGNVYYDSLVSEANIIAVANAEAKYNTERNLRIRKEAELKEANALSLLKESQLNVLYLLGTLLILLGIGLVVFIKFREKRRNLLLIQGQKALIDAQNSTLNRLNSNLSNELDDLKIEINEKENLISKVFTSSQREELPPEIKALSPRETEVLAFMALGLSNDQLAERLFVSQATIKTHVRRIFDKLLVKNRAEAVAIAHKYGIIGELTNS